MSEMFGNEAVEQFVSGACSSWSKVTEMESVIVEDAGSVYALQLRKFKPKSKGIMKRFLASFLALAPHSMATERIIPHNNNIKRLKRSSLQRDTIYGVIHISLNRKGTACYDPQPAVFKCF